MTMQLERRQAIPPRSATTTTAAAAKEATGQGGAERWWQLPTRQTLPSTYLLLITRWIKAFIFLNPVTLRTKNVAADMTQTEGWITWL